MIVAIVLIVITFAVFYVLIPELEAVKIRRQWQSFRIRFRTTGRFGLPQGMSGSGNSRFYGQFEGYEEPQILWLRSGERIAAAEYTNADIYYFGKTEKNGGTEIQKIKWSQVAAMDTGMTVYAAGNTAFENGVYTLRGTQDKPLLIILDDGNADGEDTEDEAKPGDKPLAGEEFEGKLSAEQNFRDAVNEAAFRRPLNGKDFIGTLSFYIGMFIEFLILINQARQNTAEPVIILSLIALCAAPLLRLPPGFILSYQYKKMREKTVLSEIEEWKNGRDPDADKKIRQKKRLMPLLPLGAMLVNGAIAYIILLIFIF